MFKEEKIQREKFFIKFPFKEILRKIGKTNISMETKNTFNLLTVEKNGWPFLLSFLK